MVDYKLAIYYALETYARRDLVYVMNKIYGKKPSNKGKGDIDITIEQPEIEEWVMQQYEDEGEK